jgi:hypothetical protein
MTPGQRKRAQRKRDKMLGWQEVTLKVGREHVEALRAFASSLPDPEPPTDPRQLDLIDRIEEELSNSDPFQGQGSLF